MSSIIDATLRRGTRPARPTSKSRLQANTRGALLVPFQIPKERGSAEPVRAWDGRRLVPRPPFQLRRLRVPDPRNCYGRVILAVRRYGPLS